MGNIFNVETINSLRIIWLKKNAALLLLFLLVINCSNESTNSKNNPQSEIIDINDVDKSDIAEVESEKYINVDSFKITENITDYCHLFGIGADFNSFKNLNREQAHKQKSFLLNTLNYKRAFLSFGTRNTPLDWDGDSETEWCYEITYWNLKNKRRFIALTTTEETWVSEETESIAFYIHDKEGVNRVHWDAFSWNLGDFIGQQYESLFDERIWTHPPVYIVLPEEGEEIQVKLGFHEYMDNDNAYNVFDSLQLYKKESTLKFNPLTYY